MGRDAPDRSPPVAAAELFAMLGQYFAPGEDCVASWTCFGFSCGVSFPFDARLVDEEAPPVLLTTSAEQPGR